MAILVISPALSYQSKAAGTFQPGDVFLQVGTQASGASAIMWLRPVGNTCPVPTCLVGTLSPGVSGEGDGMAFDSSGNLLATEGFAANTVVQFSNTGALIGNFGSGYNCHPESITVAASGNVFIGQPDCSTNILEFTSSGSPVSSFAVTTQDRGSDWVDLGTDQCTMAYTSESDGLLSYNVCTNTQGPTVTISDFASPTYAHRLITTGPFAGDTLLASTTQAELINSAGTVLKTYLTGSNLLFAINLDSDGTSFWTGEYLNGDVYKVDIATGAILLHFNVADFGFSPNPFGGIAILGEITAATSSTTSTTGVPQFGVGASSLLIAAVALAGMALVFRSGRSMKLLGR